MPTVIQHIRPVVLPHMARIVDGDSWWCYVDVDFRDIGFHEFRLDGWDTPEISGPTLWERDAAKEAKRATQAWWALHSVTGWRMLVETDKDPEKYGRWLANLWAERGDVAEFLGEHLAHHQLAVRSDGTRGTKWRDTYMRG